MTFYSTAFSAASKSDSAFDDLSASLGDPRPHPTEDALVQLGRALMTELVDVISDTALEDFQTILGEALIGAFHSGADAVWMSRGGYGLARLLPGVAPFASLAGELGRAVPAHRLV